MNPVDVQPSPLQLELGAYVWNQYNAMEELTFDSDYNDWVVWNAKLRRVILRFGARMAIDQEKPDEPTETSSAEEKAKHKKWEENNSFILELIQPKICSITYSSLQKKTNNPRIAKQMLDSIEQFVIKQEKLSAHLTLQKLMSMRYDGEGDVFKYLTEMEFIIRRLKAAEVNLPQYMVNQLALHSLPSQFVDLITPCFVEENWDWLTLVKKCITAENLLRSMKKNGEDEDNNNHQQGGNGAKRKSDVGCYHCGEKGHIARNCWHITPSSQW